MTFDSTNWFIPVIVAMYARNDGAAEDPHTTTITHTVDPHARPTRATSRRSARIAANPGAGIDLLVVDDETPGVFVQETRRLDCRLRVRRDLHDGPDCTDEPAARATRTCCA